MPLDPQVRRRSGRGNGARVDAALLCALVALCAAILAGFAWTRPTTTSSAVTYEQVGALTYSAPTNPTSVYGTAGLETGQPIYQKLINTLQITYTYRFQSSSPADLHGTERLVAQIGDTQGFSRTLPLQPSTPFHGTTFSTSATLHLATLQALVAPFDALAGGGSGLYSLSILPQVVAHGHLPSTALKLNFDPAANFDYSSTVLTPTSNGTTGKPASATATHAGTPIVTTSSGSTKLAAAHPVALFAGLSVLDGRIASLVVLAAALSLGVLFAKPLLKELTSEDERLRIRTRSSSALVEVTSFPRPAGALIELASFEGLRRVSRQLECPLLYLHTGGADEYAVVDNGTTYIYRIPARPSQLFGKVASTSAESPRHALTARPRARAT